MVWDDVPCNGAPKWDPNELPAPDQNIEAEGPIKAAEVYAERNRRGDVSLIVWTESIGYLHVELIRTWQVELYRPKTLAELCDQIS